MKYLAVRSVTTPVYLWQHPLQRVQHASVNSCIMLDMKAVQPDQQPKYAVPHHHTTELGVYVVQVSEHAYQACLSCLGACAERRHLTLAHAAQH